MTEVEWLGCTDPNLMLGWLLSTGKFSDRKLRLFAVACCRRVWDVLEHGTGRDAVEVAERFADGQASFPSLQAAKARMEQEAKQWDCWVPYESADLENAEAAWAACAATSPIGSRTFLKVVDHAANAATGGGKRLAWPSEFHPGEALRAVVQERLADEARAQCGLLRDIFRPAAVGTARQPPHVLGLAETIYMSREFDRHPELADELEDSGCDNSEILGHCREQVVHVRGCWAIDLLLGRA